MRQYTNSDFSSNQFITLTEDQREFNSDWLKSTWFSSMFFGCNFNESRLSPRSRSVCAPFGACIIETSTVGSGNEKSNQQNNQTNSPNSVESICSGKWFSFHWHRISNVRGWTFKTIWTLLDKSGRRSKCVGCLILDISIDCFLLISIRSWCLGFGPFQPDQFVINVSFHWPFFSDILPISFHFVLCSNVLIACKVRCVSFFSSPSRPTLFISLVVVFNSLLDHSFDVHILFNYVTLDSVDQVFAYDVTYMFQYQNRFDL